MLNTPGALLLFRGARAGLLSVGEDERPETAESTLVRSDVSADMVRGVVRFQALSERTAGISSVLRAMTSSCRSRKTRLTSRTSSRVSLTMIGVEKRR